MRTDNTFVCALCILSVLFCSALPANNNNNNNKQVLQANENEIVEVVVGVKQSARGVEEIDRLFWEISDVMSPKYGQFLSFEEVVEILQSEQSHINSVMEWLSTVEGPQNPRLTNTKDSVVFSLPKSHKGNLTKPQHLKEVIDFILFRDASAPPSFERRTHRRLASKAKLLGEGTVKNQKNAYGVPTSQKATNTSNLQMVWGPGTFGFEISDLSSFYTNYCNDVCSINNVEFDTKNHGKSGGDNFGEGTLDVEYISSMGVGVRTLVSNTNTSSSTEETDGFGAALLDFITELSSRPNSDLPLVLSMSLGSLDAWACDTLCNDIKGFSPETCRKYLEQQRQVCMFTTQDQTARINTALAALGVRGTSIFGASGDGGSHFSFEEFDDDDPIGRALNEVSCSYSIPVFPASSPYVVAVGGTEWPEGSSSVVGWSGSGGGFSWLFDMPDHQKSAVQQYLNSTQNLPSASSFNSSKRAYPDIAALADDVPMCIYEGCSPSGGTSASSPEFAGIFSLINDLRLNKNLPPLGPLGSRIYLVAQSFPNEAFHDITSGNTKTSCAEGFPSSVGWDPQTGWGQPVWDGLVKYFAGDEELRRFLRERA